MWIHWQNMSAWDYARFRLAKNRSSPRPRLKAIQIVDLEKNRLSGIIQDL